MITAEQLAHFETFGYLALRQAFSQEEMEAISEDFDRLLDEERQGKPFPAESRQSLYGIAEKKRLVDRAGRGRPDIRNHGRPVGAGVFVALFRGKSLRGVTRPGIRTAPIWTSDQ